MVHVLRHWHALPLGQSSLTGCESERQDLRPQENVLETMSLHEPLRSLSVGWLVRLQQASSSAFDSWLFSSLTLTCFYAQIHQPTALPARKSKDVFDRRLNANQWAKSTDIKYHQWHLVWAIAYYIYTYHLSVSWIALWFKMADPLEPGWFL